MNNTVKRLEPKSFVESVNFARVCYALEPLGDEEKQFAYATRLFNLPYHNTPFEHWAVEADEFLKSGLPDTIRIAKENGIFMPEFYIDSFGKIYCTASYAKKVLQKRNMYPSDIVRYINDTAGMPRVTFLITTNIGVQRELNRHRAASILERSTRYVKGCIPNFTDDHVSSYFNPLTYNDCLDAVGERDLARDVIPLGAETQAIMSFWEDDYLNNFFNQRDDKAAHRGARDVAQKMRLLL